MISIDTKPQNFSQRLWYVFMRLFDNNLIPKHTGPNVIDWTRIIPFVALHLACFGVFFVGVSPFAVGFALFLYALRIFSIGAFYHRFFSHKTFETNRFWQCIFAILGLTAVQRGPLWWAAHHREHHMVSDQVEDAHSPVQHGFLWSHMGWFTSKKFFHYKEERIRDFSRFPELRFLDRFDVLVPLSLALFTYGLGALLEAVAPSLNTNGWQLFIWGFCISTICVLHVTFTINSLSHCFGQRPYETNDNSKNNFLLAILTFGEGWHNNHHHYPASARQGFRWWQIDLTYYLLLLLEKLRVIKNLRSPPAHVMAQGRKANQSCPRGSQ